MLLVLVSAELEDGPVQGIVFVWEGSGGPS